MPRPPVLSWTRSPRLCAGPTQSAVADAVGVIDDARARWLATEAHWTGPVMERRSPAVTDWPVNGAEIEELVSGSTPGEIDVDVIARRVGADNRGLSALRWVLTRDDAVALLGDERWCDYLTANAEVIRTESDSSSETGRIVGRRTGLRRPRGRRGAVRRERFADLQPVVGLLLVGDDLGQHRHVPATRPVRRR